MSVGPLQTTLVNQHGLPTAYKLPSTEHSCQRIWLSDTAKFSQCALPYLAIVPACVIAVLTTTRLLRPLLERWRPKWTISFVLEYPSDDTELPQGSKTRISSWTIIMFLSSVTSALALLVRLVFSPTDVATILLFPSWTLVTLLVALDRPRSSPVSLIAFYASSLFVQLMILVNNGVNLSSVNDAVSLVVTCAATVAILVLLSMPLRDPLLPSADISGVGEKPSIHDRSPEDKLRLWQFLSVSWISPLLITGKKRQLNEEDVWSLAYEFQHKRLHEAFRQLRGSVIRRALRANIIDIIIISSLTTLNTLCEFANPVLLQQLLKAMETPNSPKQVALTYALLMLVLRAISAQLDVLTLWYGRRCYERSRGEMTMMVYEKALSRKNIIVFEEDQKPTFNEASNDTTTERSNVHANGLKSQTQGKYTKFFRRFWTKSERKQTETKPPASMGKILNLIRGDVYEVAERFWFVDDLIKRPLGLVLSAVLIWKILGPSCFVGAAFVIVAQILNAFVTRILLQWERRRRDAKDKRLNVTSQFVEALRHLRWYGWQGHWLQQIMTARQRELNLFVATELWRRLIQLFNSFGSQMFPVFAFFAYTYLAGHTMSIDIIFPALQLFGKLESSLREIPGLITSLLNAYIAVVRLEDFMSETDRRHSDTDDAIESSSIRLTTCDFAWPGTTTPVLRNLNLTFSSGISVIYGVVGAGKTALLQALLGELDKLAGTSCIPDEMIGYCAQTPWLQSMSIRDNILFSAPYDSARYYQVLDACALLPDFAEFKHGDLSNIGENGIGLSGGQRARVALARAVYSTANILLLDDPLSALDFNTAESIVQNCFNGPLMKGRTVVLVTHRTELIGSSAKQFIKISHGKARLLDTHVFLENDDVDESENNSDAGFATVNTQDPDNMPEKFMGEEHRAQWGVQTRVYWKYIESGTLKFWAFQILTLAAYRFLSIYRSWFLKSWGEAYGHFSRSFMLLGEHREYFAIRPVAPHHRQNLTTNGIFTPFDEYPPPQDNVKPWLLAYLIIGLVLAIAEPCTELALLLVNYKASKSLFIEAMTSVSKATFRWYDVTPVGLLMNRLTSDMGTIDGNINSHFSRITFELLTWTSAIIIIASVTPTFLAFSLILTATFVIIFLRFLPTSQSLRRLEMVSLSPLMSNFGELLHGLATVRAFHAQSRFQERVISVVDKFQGMDHFYWSTQAWLMYRYDNLAAFSTFILTALALYTNVSPGMTAFVLTAASNFIGSTRSLCRRYGSLQMDFVSVERIDELLRIEHEPAGAIDPPASWPIFGSSIVFQNATIRYAPHLDPSLVDVSLRIPGGSTTAIVGRTGSGKSTLAISLLNVVRPESGSISIDNLNIAEVDTEKLRSRVTFVAQDPVLFPGSIRLNLDPIGTYTDEQCSLVLERLCGRHGWTLDTNIEAGGRNLSQGQRQLIGLSRAVLRRSPIVILDEATASIDYETSMEIQQILREEMVEATVIMIAHRVEAVKGADYAVVLDKGRVVRQGPAKDMLGDGIVGALAEDSEED